ncbi:MAG TPA: GntR family transcriptional regulator [Acidimicrobiales bacterium]|nr:GntR family transcriptional regulator [Acidimicrobiales bacterium]
MATEAPLPRLRQESLADRAYAELKEAILGGRFEPGASMAEVELAEALGISRTPVREALALLRRDGLIESTPGGTSVVRVLEPGEVRELFLIREALECLALREHIKGDAVHRDGKALSALVERQRKAAAKGDVVAFLEADEEFHLTVCHEAGLEHVAELLASLREKMRQAGLRAVTEPDRMKKVLREHERIVKALRAGDGEAAADALQTHLGATQRAFDAVSNR